MREHRLQGQLITVRESGSEGTQHEWNFVAVSIVWFDHAEHIRMLRGLRSGTLFPQRFFELFARPHAGEYNFDFIQRQARQLDEVLGQIQDADRVPHSRSGA